MIHLSTLSAALLRPAAEESVAASLAPTGEADGAPVYGPPYEPQPSLPASHGAGTVSLFASLARLFELPALHPQPPVDPTRVIAGMPGDPCFPAALNAQPTPSVAIGRVVAGIPPDPIAPVALNPQPLPPGDPKRALVSVLDDRLAKVALNPQPLPPRETLLARPSKITDRLTAVGLNPQPLPPRERAVIINDPLVAAGLNPQPLPPRGDSVQDISKPFVRLGYLPPFAE
jgi:hypothetical protein